MAAANIPLTGIVNTQAVIRLLVIPHRTAERRLVAPTPIIAPVMVWVVLTGIFRYSVRYNVNAPAVSATTPSKGVTLVILVPMVFTIFHPPDIVPKEMAVKKGDNIIVSKYSGTEVELDGEEYIIVKQSDILAIME